MSHIATNSIERLEELAAWHRANANHAGSLWVWDARLRAAEDLERQAAVLRAQLERHRANGSDDQIVPINASARATVKLVPDAILKIYPDAPHGLAETHRDKLNADLEELCRS